MKKQLAFPLGLAIALGTAAPAALAQTAGTTVFVQGGGGSRDVNAASIGIAIPSAWRFALAGGEIGLHWELFASQWNSPQVAGGRKSFIQLGAVPMFRWRPDGGRGKLFVEAGIGVSVTDDVFTAETRTFSTRWNFSDNLAAGLLFGEREQHEVSVRWQHTSNAGLKRPNPGQDLLLLRYGWRF